MPQSPHRLRNDLKCVEWDVKPYTTNQVTQKHNKTFRHNSTETKKLRSLLHIYAMTKNHIIVSDPTIWQSGSAVSRQTQSVASLGLVSPGAATEGATPIFPEKKLTTFFRYHRLSLLQYHPYLFSPLKLTTFFCSSATFFSFGCHPPEGVTRGGPPPPLVTPLDIVST